MKRSQSIFRNLLSVILLLSVAAFAQKPDRSAPPELGPPPSLKLPTIQHLKLSNGLPILLMEKHEVPLVQINLLIKAGAAMDPEEKTGLATMTAAMLDEGAGKRNSLELADAIDFLGADISASAGEHTSAVSLHTPLSKLDSALALFADVSLRPTFPAEELERLRTARLTTLLQWHDEPRIIASVLLSRELYTTEHPYGRTTTGTVQSTKAMSRDDLMRFYRTYYRPNNAAFIVVGDITSKDILPKLEKSFGSWKAEKLPQQEWPPIHQVEKREIFLVDKPGAPQSVIRIGRVGVERKTEDYYSLVVMNTILGGSFTSRLNANLREDKGYTYGAGSYFDFMPMPGPFVATASVQTEVTDKALTEFMKELKGILAPVSDVELTRAKNYIALSYPGDFQTIQQVAGQLSQLVVYDLPDDYFDHYVDKILAVTKDDVERVAKKYLDPEKVDIIIVGDSKTIRAGIHALNLGPLHELSIEDVLGKKPEM